MDMRSLWMLLVAPSLALALVACSSGGVVYVDERGNELAVDEQGQPIIPGRSSPRVASSEAAGAGAPAAQPAKARPARARPPTRDVAVTWETGARSTLPAERSAATRSGALGSSAELELPPAPAAVVRGSTPRTGGATFPADALPEAKPAAPKKVESSSKLGGPPAG